MENSKIEWCDHTFNPWSGCIKVSPGCVHCYAETLSNRWGKDIWGPGAKRQRTSSAYWKKPLKWNKQAANEGRRFRVFCASMADVFEDNPQVSDWRSDLWDLIELTPNLDWLLLTKRPEKVLEFTRRWTPENYGPSWPDNIWVGTSVENQKYADERIPELLNIPARIRFLSIEPLLGPVDLSSIGSFGMGQCLECAGAGETSGCYFSPDGIGMCGSCKGSGEDKSAFVDWVIVGGESGPGARPMHPEWARGIRDQCQASGIPFLFKQWGEYLPVFNSYTTSDGYDFSKVGKHAAGRDLDGREWNEFPNILQRA